MTAIGKMNWGEKKREAGVHVDRGNSFRVKQKIKAVQGEAKPVSTAVLKPKRIIGERREN